MISNIIRKLNSYLSIWCKKNKPLNTIKDSIIKKYIKDNIGKNKIIRKNLKKTHNIFNRKLYSLLQRNDIKNFLRENFIQKMFFLHNRFFVYSELNNLRKNKEWPTYKKLIEEEPTGNPIRYFLYPNSSGNRINHVYHLSVLSKELNITLTKIKTVFEFGAGYGCMAQIFSKINHKINYACFDTHYVNLLQYYYLKHSNLDVGFSNKNNFNLVSNQKKIKNYKKKSSKSLFIANWSLSETPINFRKKFEPIIVRNHFIFISFQESFEDIDNLKYFQKLKSKISNRYNVKILKNKFYTGNIINKHNHYFFVGKKIKD